MASLMENLMDVLERENSEYGALLELSRRKTPVIVAGNLEELEKITDEEQCVVDRINLLDKKRAEVTADIANVMNRDVAELKLINIMELLEKRPEERKKLSDIHDRLRATVREMVRVNEHNRELIQSSLEMVDYNLNILQAMRSAPETADYTSDARNAGVAYGGRLSGSFDAKQ